MVLAADCPLDVIPTGLLLISLNQSFWFYGVGYENIKGKKVWAIASGAKGTRQTRLPVKPNQVERYDYSYERNGVADNFMFFEPLKGRIHVETREDHTAKTWAECMKILADKIYPKSEKIVIAMDNLRTHKVSAFYENYPPEEARRLVERFEFHFTPKHASWLNMAEIAISIMNKECLDRRIPNLETMKKELHVWQNQRNQKEKKVDWQFTCENARIKLKKLYPSI